ncbi:MAG: tetratricopeptide repeat protein [Bacteroidales bacterium]|nr:tetratricopeptide repeat protein [Bacteroidales bacterium]
MKNSRLHQLIIVILVALFYCDTLSLNYALDDRMVLMENKSVVQGGWKGVKEIFTQDSFTGYFGSENSLVAGGRYRPMSQLTFLIEVQLFGKDVKSKIGNVDDFRQFHNAENEAYFVDSNLPLISHLFNMLYYALLCLLIYVVMRMLFEKYEGSKWYQSLPFIVAVLFAIHPIHTEAVANVKGRDEIFAMLGAMAALWCSLRYADKHQWWYLLLSFAAMMFALFSKENAITFLAIVPLSIYFYHNDNKRKSDYVATLVPMLAASIIFIVVRAHVLGGFMPEDTTHNVLNNPFLNASKADEIATVLLTWGIYLRLLIFPHPLTHDYYPWKMQISSFANPLTWVIVLACLALAFIAIKGLKKKSISSYALLFFAITFSITSNLLFNLGTFMNERFVFIPSLGFVLLVGYLLYRVSVNKTESLQKFSVVALFLLTLLCGAKTISRNLDWKDDFTLFLKDVHTSENSIKCNISAGGSYLQMWKKSHKESDKQNAYKYLNKAMQLDPYALNAHLLMGDLMFMDDNKSGAYEEYHTATLIDPNNAIARENMQITSNVLHANELNKAMDLLNEGKPQEALDFINKKLEENPDDLIAMNIKGNVLGRGFQRLDDAIALFQKVVSIDDSFSSAWENMGIAYAMKGNVEQAEKCLLKAHALSPDDQNVIGNLQILYRQMGQPDKMIP